MLQVADRLGHSVSIRSGLTLMATPEVVKLKKFGYGIESVKERKVGII
jgi:hypothetical protein